MDSSGRPPLVYARGVEKSYATAQGPLRILDGVDLTLASGETLALMGESGSGKSTLLHLLAGLDQADRGEIDIDGARLDRLDEAGRARLRRASVGIVFQRFNLVSTLTVGANLAFQARLAGSDDPAWREDLTRRLGLSDLLERYPEQLSGGQQQRVAIGRALAARPRLLLADEPTGNLDEAAGDAVLDLALELVAATGCALLMATHSARIAARLGRRVRLLHGALDPS
jgi:putative ABC transport system ATP-binding protein